MKVLFFSTSAWDNVKLAYAANKWAVSPGKDLGYVKSLKTKASNLNIGDLVFFWVTSDDELQPSILTMPSIVTSVPQDGVVRHPWRGAWDHSFSINPIGRYDLFLSKDELESKLIGIDRDRNLHVQQYLQFNCTFAPCNILYEDLSYLLDQLLDNHITMGQKREILQQYHPIAVEAVEAVEADVR